jgi:hypothetical protein
MEISNSGYEVIRTANLRRSGVATIRPLGELCEMPAGSNHGRLKVRPAIPWDGIGIKDRDRHELYYCGSSDSPWRSSCLFSNRLAFALAVVQVFDLHPGRLLTPIGAPTPISMNS